MPGNSGGRTTRDRRAGCCHLDGLVNDDFLNALAHLDDLRRAGLGMRLDAAALGPGISIVVMIDIADQEAASVLWTIRRMSRLTRIDQKFGSFDLSMRWNCRPRRGGVHLQIENGFLNRLLLLRGKAANADWKLSAMQNLMT